MSSKQEVLRFLRDQTGDRKLSYDATMETLQDRDDIEMLEIIDGLETEFGIELPGEMLVDLDSVGDLCELVVEMQHESAALHGDQVDTEGGGDVRYTRM